VKKPSPSAASPGVKRRGDTLAPGMAERLLFPFASKKFSNLSKLGYFEEIYAAIGSGNF
jgi:hypothetical protein